MRALNVHICMEILWKQLEGLIHIPVFNMLGLTYRVCVVGVSCSVSGSDSDPVTVAHQVPLFMKFSSQECLEG